MPPVAGQRIDYRGRTSQDGRIRLQVLQRDSGRGFLLGLSMFITFTCEDASTQSIRFGYGSGQRLGEDGSFGIHDLYSGISGMTVDIDGVVRWGSAEGTLEIREAALTDDGSEAQLCTTGLLDWTADRAGSRPARPLLVPDGVTKVQIARAGELRVIAP